MSLAATALLGSAPAAAGAAPITLAVPGGKVRVLDMPKRDRWIRDAVVLTVSEELAEQKALAIGSIDPTRCSTGEVLITLEKQVTLERKWQEFSGETEPQRLGGLLVRGAPCRIWLNARAVQKLDEARICNLVRHELGHARGLDHTAVGLMAATTPILPVRGCEWAESEWLTDDD